MPKNQNRDPSVQALVHGETWSLPSSTSHLIRKDAWTWHIIGGKDELEDKSNWQYGQGGLPLCREQKAIITTAIGKRELEECLPHQPRSGAVWEVCQLTEAELSALPRFLLPKLMAGRRSHTIPLGWKSYAAEEELGWLVGTGTQIWSGAPTTQLWMKQVYPWGRKSTLDIMSLELQTPEN